MKKTGKKKISLRYQLVILLGGTILGFSVLLIFFLTGLFSNVLGAYVQNDLDYALESTSSKLATKTEFLADVLLAVRRSPALTEALRGDGLTTGRDETSATQAALQQAVNIYSDKNTDNLPGAFLDSVYLFDPAGHFNLVSYTDRLSNLQEALNNQYVDSYRAFTAGGEDASAALAGDRLNIFYTLYDEQFNELGTLIFVVNADAVRELMSKTLQYPGAFWYLLDKNGTPLLTGGTASPAEEMPFAQILQNQAPYTGWVGATSYRLSGERVDMGLSAVMAVPANLLAIMLYDSVKYYVSALLLALALVAALVFGIVVKLTQPLKEMADKLQMVADERFDTKLPAYANREFDLISSTFNAMTDKISHLINDVYEKKLLVLDMEMRFLQSQTNPHFMYNVLNTIALQAQLDGNEEIHRMAANFSGLTQARMAHRGDAKVTLEQELAYARFYLDIQKARFADSLQYNIHVADPALLRYHIPKLTIEMIVENAVQHGIEPKLAPGTVYIDLYGEKNGICIAVEDDGVGFRGVDGEVPLPLAVPPAAETGGGHNHIALNNAWQLIRHFYGENYGIHIYTRQNVGTFVTIRIPYDEGDAADHPTKAAKEERP